MYGTKGSSDSDTTIWDDVDRESEPSGKTLGDRSVFVGQENLFT